MVANELARFDGRKYFVTGTQDAGIAKTKPYQEAMQKNKIKADRSYYSFDKGGIHFVVLNTSFDSLGNAVSWNSLQVNMACIPVREQEWLRNDLFTTLNPVIVFVHHQLSGSGNIEVQNADKVRTILESSGKVICVFQGQNHTGQYSRNNGIHYYSLRAMVNGSFPDNNSFALVTVTPTLINIKGYKNAISLRLRFPEIRTYDLYRAEGEFDFEPWEEF
jgi:alkaline phosphatase